MSTTKGPINSLLHQLTVPKCAAVAVWHQTSILALMEEASCLCYLSRNAEFEQHGDFKGVGIKFLRDFGDTFLLVTGQFLARSIVIRSACLCSISFMQYSRGSGKFCVSHSVAPLRFFQSQRCNDVEGGGGTSNWGQVSQWQAVIARLFPSNVAPAAAFPGWNITLNSDNYWGSDAFPINKLCVSVGTSRSASGDLRSLHRTVGGVNWKGKNWRAEIAPEGEHRKLARYRDVSPSHCNSCHVENRTATVLMMMAITA